jgi:hypothetical protein
MSLDRIQSKFGLLSFQAEPGFTVASSLSSVRSNQMPGGYQFGENFAVLAASSNSLGGGAVVIKPSTVQTSCQAVSSGTGAMIGMDNNPVILASLSAGGLHNLQPALYHGQLLTLINMANVSGSIVTGCILSGQGTGSTTTAVIPTLTVATTFTSYGKMQFIALSNYGGSASNSTVNLWQAIA